MAFEALIGYIGFILVISVLYISQTTATGSGATCAVETRGPNATTVAN